MADALPGPEPVPLRTEPQGTQEHGVESGFEERDVDFRALTRWFGGLVVGTLLLMVVVLVGLRAWVAWDERTLPEQPAVFILREDVPGPRVLPNPQDDPPAPRSVLPEPQQIPARWGPREQRDEEKVLEAYGLFDRETGRPTLPEQAVRAVVTAPDPEPPPGQRRPLPEALRRPMPSDASGGTVLENRLR